MLFVTFSKHSVLKLQRHIYYKGEMIVSLIQFGILLGQETEKHKVKVTSFNQSSQVTGHTALGNEANKVQCTHRYNTFLCNKNIKWHTDLKIKVEEPYPPE